MSDQFRLCPGCGAENAPTVMRCVCGALLAGVDITRREVTQPTAPVEQAPAPSTLTCPFDDCGQTNPPEATTCLYCNRSLADAPSTMPPAGDPVGLLQLPAELAARFRVLDLLPANGAEAELLRVAPMAGGEELIAKVYRHGLRPKAEVQARIADLDAKHCVRLLESGISGRHAWELMEYCAHGSLRKLMTERDGRLAPSTLHTIAAELAAALAAVHAAGLVHRDLKPENVLIRSREPLDLVLTDFGIASLLEATQRFTGQARTLPYASPESLSGVIDGKTDYWALGMILLEAALGRHPFAGLSEAVILHHLTTKPIETSAIDDPPLRKLVRGLLLRDPKARWGIAEIERWQAGDPSLKEPAADSIGTGFAEPYRLAGENCATPEQLAVALSRHWQTGVRDLDNGQLLEWFRKVQKDHDTVRLLIDLRHERQMHVDLQLLRLILHLAPGLPPVWRGTSVELPAILTQANRALKGDAEAAAWLDALYQHGVLAAWAEAGNAGAADLVRRWHEAVERFSDAWRERVAQLKARKNERAAGDVVNFDEVVYGRSDPARPSLPQLHARLLAIAYDANWGERLRQRLLAEIAALAADCPWLGDLGDPLTMDAASLLVLEALLPEAKKTADKLRHAARCRAADDAETIDALRAELAATLAELCLHAPGVWPFEHEIEHLEADLDRFHHLAAHVRRLGEQDEQRLALRKSVARCEPLLARVREQTQVMRRHLAINAGWLNTRTLAFLGVALLALPFFFGAGAIGPVFSVALAIGAWRIGSTILLSRRLQALLDKINGVSSAPAR